MKFLVTGGAGFIGSYFNNAFLNKGHQVVSIDLAPPVLVLPGVQYVIGDIRDKELMLKISDQCDAVLHLAAAHHDFGITSKTFESVNVDGARIICDVAAEQKINRICFFSTVAVYGSTPPPVDESTPPAPESPYGKTKHQAEQVFEQWTTGGGRQCLIIRPTVTFGPDNYANMFTLISQIDRGLFVKVGDGKNLKSLSYVENIVSATLALWLGNPETTKTESPFDIYNFVDKPDLTSEQITDIIYDELEKKPGRVRVPYLLARLLALPFDAIIALTGKNLPVSGSRIKKLARSETKFEADKIRDAGCAAIIPLEQGIREMVKWYLAEGKTKSKTEIRRSLPSPEPQLARKA